MATNPLQSGGCAPGEVIALLAMGREAAGLLPEAEAESWMAHVAGCEQCAELLRMALAQNAAELTAEQQGIASQLTAPASGFSKPPASKRNLWLLAGAVAATLVIAFVAMQSRQQEDVPQLLAQAYTETRPFEWRLPDTGYSPVRVQRGGAGSGSIDLESLRLLLAKNTRPQDRKLRAWFEVLQGQDPAPAIATLQQVVAEQPADTDAANLLGVALARRADLTQSPGDFDAAIQIWSRALEAKPANSAMIRNNRAIAYARSGQVPQAIAELEILLRESAPDDPWQTELRRQLERLRGTSGAH